MGTDEETGSVRIAVQEEMAKSDGGREFSIENLREAIVYGAMDFGGIWVLVDIFMVVMALVLYVLVTFEILLPLFRSIAIATVVSLYTIGVYFLLDTDRILWAVASIPVIVVVVAAIYWKRRKKK